MIKNSILITLCLFTIGCSAESQAKRNINRVFDQIRAARQTLEKNGETMRAAPDDSLEKVLASISLWEHMSIVFDSLPIEACPKDFRLAVQDAKFAIRDFLKCLQDYKALIAKHGESKALQNAGDFEKEFLAVITRLESAFRDIERAAAAHGVVHQMPSK